MKRILLVFASLLIGLTTATATEQNNRASKIKLEKKKNYRNAQPIMFSVRDVEFLIFIDGTFDFNTNDNKRYNSDTYYRNSSRRSAVNTNQRVPNANIKYTSNRKINKSVSISRDRNGKINRIGNVYLNYDRYGRITRAGSIIMSYNRGKYSDLEKVGGLQVKYNRFGEIINTRGHVNRYDNRNYNDFYYYKQNGKVIKQKKSKESKR